MRRSTKQIVSYVALTVVVLGSAGMAYAAVSDSGTAARSNTRTVPVSRGTVTQTVSATGNLEPANPIDMNFQTSGTITAIDVTEGQQVNAGDVLATLDPSTAQANLDVAKLDLTAAQTKLTQARSGSSSSQGSTAGGTSTATQQAQLQADRVALTDAQSAAMVNAKGYQLAIDQANAQLAEDQQTLASDQQACSSDPSSSACGRIDADQSAVDKDQRAVASAQQAQAAGLQKDQQTIHAAQAKVDLDQANLTSTRSSSIATVDAAAVDTAQAGVIQAQSGVDTAQKALDATTLTAPAAGRVTSVTKSVGDQVSAGSSSSNSNGSTSSSSAANSSSNNSSSNSSSSSAFITIIDPTAFQVKVGFPESDAIKLQVGQVAATTLDALPASSLSGSVESIDETATVTSNVVTYDAVVSVAGAPSSARSGMTANVVVTTVSKDDVVQVATAAVQTQAGATFVEKLVNGQTVRTPVTTGIQGDSTTEIASGLNEGDEVVVSTGTVASTGTGRTGGNGTFGGGGGGGGGGGFVPGGGGFGAN